MTLQLDETSSSFVVFAMRVCGQHANLLREVFELSCLLRCAGKDQLFFRHGSGIAGCVELFMQDVDSCGEFGGFLIELMEVGDLPSQPPVVKVADVALQVHEVAAGPNEKGAEPGREWFDGVFLAMPNHVSLRIQIDNIGGLIRALLLVESSNPSVFQLLDPLCWFEDSVAEGNEEVGHLPVILDVPIGGPLKYVFIMFDMVVKSADLLIKAVDFAGFLGVMSGDGCKEPLCNGLEYVGIEVRVGRQGGRNSTGRHRWFRALDRTDRERDAIFGG